MRFVLDLSVREFLKLHCQCRNHPEISPDDVLAMANQITPEPVLPEESLNLLSGGQTRALMIADLACICDSPIVLIDEIENAGIDKKAALRLLTDQSKLVLIVTHDPHCPDGIHTPRNERWGGLPDQKADRGGKNALCRAGCCLRASETSSGITSTRRRTFMTTIRLYWNNICVLHRQELQFLNEIREELRKDNIDLDITCFSLGYGRHMSNYLREEDSVLPDLVVSTDLEVFEDERIWNRFREHGLLPLKEFFPVKDIPELGGLKKASALLPYLAIPLVFYSDVELLRQTSMDARSINANFFTGTDADSEQSISLNQLVESSFPLSYGGINNSAVKTVAKLTWESFGMETAKHFLTASNVFDMPIQAFHQVSIGASPLALVPSVYALRADGKKNKAYWPLEGAPTIPSYICAGTSVPKDALFAVIEKLRGPRFSHFYTTNGCLYSCAPADPLPDLSFLEGSWTNRGLLVPSESFLNSLPAETFYKMYHRVFPAGS